MSSLSPSLAPPRTPSGLGCATLRPLASSPAKSPSFTPDGPAFSDDIAFDPQSRPSTELEDWPSNGAPDGVGPDDPRRQDSSTRPKISPHRGAVTSTGRGHGPGSQYQHPVTRESREVLTPRPLQSATDKGPVASAPHGVGKGKKVAPEAPALVKAGSETDPAPRKAGLDAQESPPAAQTNRGKRRYDEPHLARPRPFANPGKENQEPPLDPTPPSKKTRPRPKQAKGVEGNSKGSPGMTPGQTSDGTMKNHYTQLGVKFTKRETSTVPPPPEEGVTPVSVQGASSRPMDPTSRAKPAPLERPTAPKSLSESSLRPVNEIDQIVGDEYLPARRNEESTQNATQSRGKKSKAAKGEKVVPCLYDYPDKIRCKVRMGISSFLEHYVLDHRPEAISRDGDLQCGMQGCEEEVHLFDVKGHLRDAHEYTRLNESWKMPCGDSVERIGGVVMHVTDPTRGCEDERCSSILDDEMKTILFQATIATTRTSQYKEGMNKLTQSTWHLNIRRRTTASALPQVLSSQPLI
ncbi:hypothetical protein DFP72DRAFT_82664 [Ephemerocybe angulata]|uniref:Uncharacterized protein n=1 Tax=Ephemerocybe angulata TaxID=980116 RepID=A0A8H6HDY0_9AGAR|nr:hypothetical protein DFP72DRAFT_82664 [Tulosesus angulatus]